MTTAVVTQDALELMVHLNAFTKDLVDVVQSLHSELAEYKRATEEPVLLTEALAAAYLGVKRQWLAGLRRTGELPGRTPPPAHLQLSGVKGDGEKPNIYYERKELDRWLREDVKRTNGRLKAVLSRRGVRQCERAEKNAAAWSRRALCKTDGAFVDVEKCVGGVQELHV